MKIACLQFAPRVGDVPSNMARAEAVLAKAEPSSLDDLDLLVLPEMAFSGKDSAPLICGARHLTLDRVQLQVAGPHITPPRANQCWRECEMGTRCRPKVQLHRCRGISREGSPGRAGVRVLQRARCRGQRRRDAGQLPQVISLLHRCHLGPGGPGVLRRRPGQPRAGCHGDMYGCQVSSPNRHPGKKPS